MDWQCVVMQPFDTVGSRNMTWLVLDLISVTLGFNADVQSAHTNSWEWQSHWRILQEPDWLFVENSANRGCKRMVQGYVLYWIYYLSCWKLGVRFHRALLPNCSADVSCDNWLVCNKLKSTQDNSFDRVWYYSKPLPEISGRPTVQEIIDYYRM